MELPDLDGKTVKLADYKGKQTLLVFWNPGCGFCKKMVDDLKAWENDKPEGAPEVMLVSTGTVESNKAMGLSSTTVIDEGFATGRKFGATGTPSAILIDPTGKIASEIAGRRPERDRARVRQEAGSAPLRLPRRSRPPRRATRHLRSSSRISTARSSISSGTRRTPCSSSGIQAAASASEWQTISRPGRRKNRRTAPEIVLVTTGTVEANKAMDIPLRTLMDEGFSTGRKFGAGGTPSAVLVDGKGKIASDVAVGAPAVMALAGQPVSV